MVTLSLYFKKDIHSTAKNPALRKLTPICIILGVNREYVLERRMDLPNFPAGRQVPTLSFANNPQDAADPVKVFFIVELGFFRVELV